MASPVPGWVPRGVTLWLTTSWLHPAFALKRLCFRLGTVSPHSGETGWRSLALRSGQRPWEELDEPLAGEDLRKSVVGPLRNMGFSGPQALDDVPQDGIVDYRIPREVSGP